MNVQKMYIKSLHIYKKCSNCTELVQSSGLKLKMYVFCIQTMYKLYKIYTTS